MSQKKKKIHTNAYAMMTITITSNITTKLQSKLITSSRYTLTTRQLLYYIIHYDNTVLKRMQKTQAVFFCIFHHTITSSRARYHQNVSRSRGRLKLHTQHLMKIIRASRDNNKQTNIQNNIVAVMCVHNVCI